MNTVLHSCPNYAKNQMVYKKIYSIKTNPIKLFAETVSIVYSTAKRPKYITDPKPILKIADYTDSVSSKYSCDSYA